MKQFFIFIFLLFTLVCFAQTNPNHVYVSGYYRSNGTYVKGHYRTAPNSTNRDNFSTRGNVNPYTREPGYITPDNNYSTTSTSNGYPTYSSSNTTTSRSVPKITYSESTVSVNEIFDIDLSKIYALPSKYVSAIKANLRLGPTIETDALTWVERNNIVRIIDNSTYNTWTKIIVEKDDGFYIGFLKKELISDERIKEDSQEGSPSSVVKDFLRYLGERRFYSAFSLTNNPQWNKNGGYKWFSSNEAYGGIDYVNIYKVRLENVYEDKAVVYADYYARDPLHTSRRWKQILILEFQYGVWKIVKAKLAE